MLGWQEWDYSIDTATEQWKNIWGWSYGPHGRRGHSMVLSGTKIILFGGRDNEKIRNHAPKSYEIINENGELKFKSYDDGDVLPRCSSLSVAAQATTVCCEDNVLLDDDPDEDIKATYTSDITTETTCVNMIPTGGYFNDVWTYELNCTRFSDESCQYEDGLNCPSGEDCVRAGVVDYEKKMGWAVEHPGAIDGECKIVLGRTICTVPTERWLHGAAMFNDTTMLIYGGFSQRCEDYCNDMWSYDIRSKDQLDGQAGGWMEIYELGELEDPTTTPGRRWKFSVICDGERMFLFGGYKIWHGFSTMNSRGNEWSDFSDPSFPPGGYMDDLWEYRKILLTEKTSYNDYDIACGWVSEEDTIGQCMNDDMCALNRNCCPLLVPTTSYGLPFVDAEKDPTQGYGVFTQLLPKSIEYRDPGDTWRARNDKSTITYWPQGRAGHAATYDISSGICRRRMWIHGGFTTYYPYIKTSGAGADTGVVDDPSDLEGFSPYPTYPFYLDDLWYYDFQTGFWVEVKVLSLEKPSPRVDHIMEISGHVIFLFGGYAHNNNMDDTWLFNVSSSRWLEKWVYPHPIYPDSCVDDWTEYIMNPVHECMLLRDQLELQRVQTWRKPNQPGAHVMAAKQQDYYVPDKKHSGTWYYGIIENNAPRIERTANAESSLYWTKERRPDRRKEERVKPYVSTPDQRTKSGDRDLLPKASVVPDYYGTASTLEEDELHLAGVPQVEWIPVVPYAATGPYQFVRRVNESEEEYKAIGWGNWSNGTVYMRCTSNFGEPTRVQEEAGLLDGLYGRSSERIRIPIPRRQSPGWDGCRDRYNDDEGFVNELAFIRPQQRSDHRSIYIDLLPLYTPEAPIASQAERAMEKGDVSIRTGVSVKAGKKGEIYIFGGVGYSEVKQETYSETYESIVREDFWRLGVHECLNNCSSHGVCDYGFCTCFDGYYGTDCSNISCPGDYCWYDNVTHVQHCQHCCHSGHHHVDGEDWTDGINKHKVQCTIDTPGESNGVCDGYGHCQCAPPFLGEDCSMKDCVDNCNYNGYCSVEYPISRCVCNPGYYGPECQYRICLNNCSYPRGICDPETGQCTCYPQKNPYYNQENFTFFQCTDQYKKKIGQWITVGAFKSHWYGDPDHPKYGGELLKGVDGFVSDFEYTNGLDCSYIMAYAAGSTVKPSMWLAVAVVAWGFVAATRQHL